MAEPPPPDNRCLLGAVRLDKVVAEINGALIVVADLHAVLREAGWEHSLADLTRAENALRMAVGALTRQAGEFRNGPEERCPHCKTRRSLHQGPFEECLYLPREGSHV